MKAIPILVGVLAAAVFPVTGTAAQAEKARKARILPLPAGGELPAAGGQSMEVAAGSPRIIVQGPADATDGDEASYSFSVANDGSDRFDGPFTIDLEFTTGLLFVNADAQGWTCAWNLPGSGSCEWPAGLDPGETTDTVRLDVMVTPPYLDQTACDPGRSPCVVFRGYFPVGSGFPPGEAFSAVTVGGNTPPVAADDRGLVGAPPAPVEVDVLANDSDFGDALAVSMVSGPFLGTVAIDPVTQAILYTPGPDFASSDFFRYRITDPAGATATALVYINVHTGGIAFDRTVVDIGNLEPGRIAERLAWLSNTTGYPLTGTWSVEAVAPGDVAGALTGTPYDPTQVVFDPAVLRPVDATGASIEGIPDVPVFFTCRAKPAVGAVYLARVRLTVSPVGAPGATSQAEVFVVARSADATEVPVHAVDDGVSTPADTPAVFHVLLNDDSVAGETLSVSGWSIVEPFDHQPPSTEGTVEFADIQNGTILALRYTPTPGFVGTTQFYYAASEQTAGSSSGRYDWAKVTVTVGALPPPPVAVATGSTTICAGTSAALTGSGGVSCSWSPTTGLDDASSCTPTASPASTTTYTLSVVDQHGQSSTNNPTVTATVNPLPIAVAGGSATINLGQSTPLSGSGGASCAWSPATGLDDAASCTPIASPVVTTAYALVVTSAAGCASTNPAIATITVVPADPPDLLAAAVRAPSETEPGGTMHSVRATIWNYGLSAAGPSTARFYLSRNRWFDAQDVLLAGVAVPSLGPNQLVVAIAYNVPVPNVPPGHYYVIAYADADHLVPEVSETNNTSAYATHLKPVRP